MLRQGALIFIIGFTLVVAHAYPNVKAKFTDEIPIVTTTLGQIQGNIINSSIETQIFQFRGIRYAKPPVDELRFQPPVPVENWEGIYNATEDGPVCPQPTTERVDEDCLFINVYTGALPKENENITRPVIVYIHPGGFYSLTGASNWEGPQYLLSKDIVLVTMNYRLGSLGFLSTGEKEAPGNLGLKDQVLALKWIKQNIAAFGGDPNLVTIMGYSAGGASITLHLVSPMSQGLFHRAIIMSGSSLGNWPVPSHQLDLAKKQAKFVGCPDETSASDIVKCLKTIDAKQLGDSLNMFDEFAYDPVLVWLPVIEEDFGQERFLPANPIDLIQSGQYAKVPVILGVTADEFALRAFTVIENSTLVEEINNNWDTVAPIAFVYERDTDNSKVISKSLRSFYLEDKPVDNSTVTGLAQAYADGVIGFGVNRAAKLLAEKSDSVYYYKFSYIGRYSHFYDPSSNGTVPYGVVHHDDLLYLFYVSTMFPEIKESDPEWQTMIKSTTMWTNFAKTGNPIPETSEVLDNVKWDTFDIETQKYLDIGNKLVMHEKMFEKRYAEWERLFPLASGASRFTFWGVFSVILVISSMMNCCFTS